MIGQKKNWHLPAIFKLFLKQYCLWVGVNKTWLKELPCQYTKAPCQTAYTFWSIDSGKSNSFGADFYRPTLSMICLFWLHKSKVIHLLTFCFDTKQKWIKTNSENSGKIRKMFSKKIVSMSIFNFILFYLYMCVVIPLPTFPIILWNGFANNIILQNKDLLN